jgi:hypothetical protein
LYHKNFYRFLVPCEYFVSFVVKFFCTETKFRVVTFFGVLPIVLAAPTIAQAQDPELTLGINKVIGYGSFGNREFQGIVKVMARGPENLQRVVFFIDGETMAGDAGRPSMR